MATKDTETLLSIATRLNELELAFGAMAAQYPVIECNKCKHPVFVPISTVNPKADHAQFWCPACENMLVFKMTRKKTEGGIVLP